MSNFLTIDRDTLSASLFRGQEAARLRHQIAICGASTASSIRHSVELLAARDPAEDRYVVVSADDSPVGISFDVATWSEIMPRAQEIVEDVADLMAMKDGGVLLILREKSSIRDLGID